jgi:hypothetical protein
VSSFAEPWEAQTFALAVSLAESGLFSWKHWTETVRDGGYDRWLAELERLVPEADLERYRRAWVQAAARTPHGKPIELEEQDFQTGPKNEESAP